MLAWIASNAANIIISLILIAVVALAIGVLVRDRRAGISSCGCKCSGCAMAGKCHSRPVDVSSLKNKA